MSSFPVVQLSEFRPATPPAEPDLETRFFDVLEELKGLEPLLPKTAAEKKQWQDLGAAMIDFAEECEARGPLAPYIDEHLETQMARFLPCRPSSMETWISALHDAGAVDQASKDFWMRCASCLREVGASLYREAISKSFKPSGFAEA